MRPVESAEKLVIWKSSVRSHCGASLPSQFCAHGVPLNVSRCATHAHPCVTWSPNWCRCGPRPLSPLPHGRTLHMIHDPHPGACSYYVPVRQFSPSFHLSSKSNFKNVIDISTLINCHMKCFLCLTL